MTELQVEFPITKVYVINGSPQDTIVFQTNMLPTHNDEDGEPQLPLLMMGLPEGTAVDYVENKLGIPKEYVEQTTYIPSPQHGVE
jgi:hypothetical protein